MRFKGYLIIEADSQEEAEKKFNNMDLEQIKDSVVIE